jgi:hypothetical protein
VGKRSRKRVGSGAELDDGSGTPTTRAQRDAARQRRADAQRRGEGLATPKARPGRVSPEDRPPPVWAPFPLTELVILGGIVLMAWGLLSGGGRAGNSRLAAGLAVASLAGLELALREHVTGFRSHSVLLAGVVAIAMMVGLGLLAGVQTLGVLLIAGALTFGVAIFGLRELFRRRSGGLSFR